MNTREYLLRARDLIDLELNSSEIYEPALDLILKMVKEAKTDISFERVFLSDDPESKVQSISKAFNF